VEEAEMVEEGRWKRLFTRINQKPFLWAVYALQPCFSVVGSVDAIRSSNFLKEIIREGCRK